MSILLKDEISTMALDASIKLLGDNFEIANLEACSYDLRIGTIFKNGEIYSAHHNSQSSWNIEVKPSEIVTILTLEEVNLPNNVIGTVFALNSLSSTGFLILNPGHIDPGYKEPISICAINLSKSTIRLHEGKKIFTIIFDKLSKAAQDYPNPQYKNRSLREEDFYRKRASALSNNLFDLVTENEYVPFLKKQINEVINGRIGGLVKVFFYIFVPIIIAIITLIYTVKDSDRSNQLDPTTSKLLELEKRQQMFSDSLVQVNKSYNLAADSLAIIKLKFDSINFVIKNKKTKNGK